ncbi:MAG: polymer-forming cytoskeletal protein [bacterium]
MNSEIEERILMPEGVQITGELGLLKSGAVNGNLKGKIFSDKRVVINKKSVIDGGVICGDCTVQGRVQGEVCAKGTVTVASGGSVRGSIAASALNIKSGAYVHASFNIGNSTSLPVLLGGRLKRLLRLIQ